MRKNELWTRSLATIGIIFILLLGKNIILPGADVFAIDQGYQSDFRLYVLSITTGGNLSLPTIFSLGVGPYMTALMIWQIIPLISKDFTKRLSQRQQGSYQKGLTLIFAILQSFLAFNNMRAYYPITSSAMALRNQLSGMLVLIAGAMLITWLADLNVQHGLGGTMVMIIPGIIFNLPAVLRANNGQLLHFTNWMLIGGWLIIIGLSWLAVFLNHAELQINVQRTGIDNDFASSYLPIKVLPAGSMPLMFALSLFSIPQYIIAGQMNVGKHPWWSQLFSFQSGWGITMYALLLVILGVCFAFVNFRPSDIAKELQESGDYILDCLPGDMTEKLLTHHVLILTAIGNAFFMLVTVVPLIIGLWYPMIRPLSFLMCSVIILIVIVDTLIIEIRTIQARRHYTIFDF